MAVTQYTSRDNLLRGLGATVRERRAVLGLSRKALAERAGLSERFLVQLESGVGNISVARLADVAQALGASTAALVAAAETGAAPGPDASPPVVALLGLRGAGKSTIGQRLARRLGVPFVELDRLVAHDAGMSLATLFELHGEQYFRRLERETLLRFLDRRERGERAVLATSGSLVTDSATYTLLRQRTRTVWLKARARDHWERVVAQGDGRPMKDRADAMSELRALLEERAPLYARAECVVDTSAVGLDEAVERVASWLNERGKEQGP